MKKESEDKQGIVYFDTSALAKWYINETGSDDVEEYLQQHGPVAISDITVVEMRSLLARRRRERDLSLQLEAEVFATFQEDIRLNSLILHSIPEGAGIGAANLISILHQIPLRTLDALHLNIARELGARVLATADRIMASGGKALGLAVVRF